MPISELCRGVCVFGRFLLFSCRHEEYSFCFSNKMSTIAHKTVYFEIVIGNSDPMVKEQQEHHQTFTQLETSLINNHDSLRQVIDLQVCVKEIGSPVLAVPTFGLRERETLS